MRLFLSDSFGRARPNLLVEAGPLRLRPPQQGDFAAWAALRAVSRSFLEPFEPTWPADDLTLASFRARLRRYRREIDDDEAYPFFLFRTADDALLGGLTLGAVRRGAAGTATLGYWMGAPHAGQGYMSAAVAAICPFAFRTLGLQRIEAACLPENEPSIRLLTRVGFQREGLGRSYLSINGQRRDHLLFALLPDDRIGPVPPPGSRGHKKAVGQTC